MPDDGNNIIDIAAALNYYEAESATLGGGATVNTSFPGFTGAGVASLGNGVAGAFADFQVNHNGTQVIIFRYANGSTVDRPCNFTINGVNAGTLNFPPTGSWTTSRTTKAAFLLGTAGGFRSFRVTATTAAGGPNLDNLEFFAL